MSFKTQIWASAESGLAAMPQRCRRTERTAGSKTVNVSNKRGA
jgi:hypothetical protein